MAAVHHLDGLPGWQYLGQSLQEYLITIINISIIITITITTITTITILGQSLQEYYLGDLLRSGFGAQPTRRAWFGLEVSFRFGSMSIVVIIVDKFLGFRSIVMVTALLVVIAIATLAVAVTVMALVPSTPQGSFQNLGGPF